jgi:hypothetical protein
VCKGVARKHLRPGPDIRRRRRTARQAPLPTLPDEPAIFYFFLECLLFCLFFFCYFASWVKGPGSCCVFKGVARKHLRPDIRIDSGVPLSWLRGRSPVLSIRRFVSRWGVAGGGVYVVVDGDLHVTLQSLDDT